jgi:hypothetical protein
MKRVSGWIRTHTIEVDDLTRHRHDRPEHGKYQCCAMPYGRRSHHSDRDRQASNPGCRSVRVCQRLSLDLIKGSNSYQQGLDVLLESLVVKALESLLVVELAGVRVAGRVVLAEDVEPQLLGPPVTVLHVVSAHIVPSTTGCRCCVDAVLPSGRHRRRWPSAWGTLPELSLRYCPL